MDSLPVVLLRLTVAVLALAERAAAGDADAAREAQELAGLLATRRRAVAAPPR